MRGYEIKGARMWLRFNHLQQRMRTPSTVVREKRDAEFDNSVLRRL